MADPVPRVTLAGQVLEAGSPTLAWAGFVSASGLDRKGWLGLGEVRDLETLLAQSCRRLTGDFLGGAAAGWTGARAARGVFLRDDPPAARPPTVAVVPFDAATGPDAARAGEEVTDLALAVLCRWGFPLASPGAVEEGLRDREILQRGAADEATREAICSISGAEVLFTGTVEEYDFIRQAPEPEPRVAFFARLLDGESGRILWMGGKERVGWDRQRLFGRGRIHSAGRLAEVMMESLIASFSAAQGGHHG